MKTPRLALLLGLLVFLTSTSFAATPEEASFLVICSDGSRGSGTAISERVVVTNSHVVGHHHQNNITVAHPSGKLYIGKTVGVFGRQKDVAFVAIDGDEPLPYVGIAVPQNGESIEVFGYGRQAILRSGKGIINSTDHGGNVNISTVIESGDSGGGVFNEEGKLVAVAWGSSGQDSMAVPSPLVTSLVEYHQTQCPGGDCWGGYSGGYNGGGRMIPVRPNRPQTPARPPVSSSPEKCPCDSSKLLVEISSLKAEVVALKAQVFKIEATAGPQGPKGDKGDKGDSGLLSDQDKTKLTDEITRAVQRRITGSVLVRVSPQHQ